MRRALHAKKPGDTLIVVVERDGERVEGRIRLWIALPQAGQHLHSRTPLGVPGVDTGVSAADYRASAEWMPSDCRAAAIFFRAVL